MRKILIAVVLFYFLFTINPIVSFAKTKTENFPWYFKVNGVERCWEHEIKGGKVIVEVWDSKVYFDALLRGKEYGYKSYVDSCISAHYDFRARIHGTGMASLIAADHGKVKCSSRSVYDCKEKYIAGIAPDAMIFNREIANFCGEWSNNNRFRILMEAMNLEKEKPKKAKREITDYGKKIMPYEEDVRTAKIVLINASYEEGKGNYFDIPQGFRKNKNYPYLLIVAGARNIVKELTEENILMPAGLKLKGLSVLRVGATNRYANKSEVDILDFYKKEGLAGSAFGKLVDILAPGKEIPILTPDFEAYVGDGTSESTAIVTGALALMADCNPNATAGQLKQALLDNSDKYEYLEAKVKNGRVLNICKAVENFCFKLPLKLKFYGNHLNVHRGGTTANLYPGFLIKNKIALTRMKAKLTQESLAKYFDVPQSYISEIESDEYKVTKKLFKKINAAIEEILRAKKSYGD